MISEEKMSANKSRYIELVKSITRENFNADTLLNYLENSDFFTAPASSKYHCAYKGGLVHHTLNVYDNLVKLVECKNLNILDDSIKIVSLFHDFAKINFYEIYYKNQKVYSESGTKVDSGGSYDWVQISSYKVIEAVDRFLYYNHEGTSEYLARCFCPLSTDESIAILHHHGGMSDDCAKDNISGIYGRNNLAVLLHLADMMACYIDESTYA